MELRFAANTGSAAEVYVKLAKPELYHKMTQYRFESTEGILQALRSHPYSFNNQLA